MKLSERTIPAEPNVDSLRAGFVNQFRLQKIDFLVDHDGKSTVHEGSARDGQAAAPKSHRHDSLSLHLRYRRTIGREPVPERIGRPTTIPTARAAKSNCARAKWNTTRVSGHPAFSNA